MTEEDSRLDGIRHKGIPLDSDVSRQDLGELGWNPSNGSTATPVATLSLPMLERNARAMQHWCANRGVHLAPHAKTGLSPELMQLQHDHGAWGMTVALPRQAALLWSFGATRVLLANEVTDPAALRSLVDALETEPSRELLFYVDSVEGVRVIERALAESPECVQLDVLVELGHAHGRTGARGVEAARLVADAVVDSTRLRLAGVAAYEGTIGSTGEQRVLDGVAALLDGVAALVRALDGQFEVDVPVVTAGGSLFFDLVVERLAPATSAVGGVLVLRSGCYLVHDHGLYAAADPAARRAQDAPVFEPALEVWARVVSMPEPGLALLDAGRRDVSFDAGLPIPLDRWRDGRVAPLEATIEALSDQHAFLRYEEHTELALGDIVRLGVSHPCTTLDRWRYLLLVDEDLTVVGSASTWF